MPKIICPLLALFTFSVAGLAVPAIAPSSARAQVVEEILGEGAEAVLPTEEGRVGPIPEGTVRTERSRWLGCSVYNTPAGLVVRSVRRHSFAQRLGLREGDLIYAIQGRRPRSIRQLHRYLFLGRDGVNRDLDIVRMGRHVNAVFVHSERSLNVVTPIR